jgi:hypothetical protein
LARNLETGLNFRIQGREEYNKDSRRPSWELELVRNAMEI